MSMLELPYYPVKQLRTVMLGPPPCRMILEQVIRERRLVGFKPTGSEAALVDGPARERGKQFVRIP